MAKAASQSEHRLFTGSFHPELESALAREVGEFKRRHGPLAPLTILVPTNLLKVYLPRRLAESFGGHANLRFQTLTDLVRSLTPAGVCPLPKYADELILDRLIRERVKPDSYFGPVREGAGFRAALLSAIRDLKQADIAPGEFRKAGEFLDAKKCAQLADLYEAYETVLKNKKVADEDDLLSLAIGSLSPQSHPESGGQASVHLTALFIYGFYDFNYLQRKLIARLVSFVPTTAFMPYHPTEAFRYAEPTLHWFEQILNVEAEPYVNDGDATMPPTLENLRSRLFAGRELEESSPPDLSAFQILSVPGEAREAREVLREAVRFCRANDRALFETAVLARTPDSYAELLSDALSARGYRAHVHGGRPLLGFSEAQAVLLLAEIVSENFGRQKMLEFVSLAPLDRERCLPEKHRASFQPSALGRISAEAGIVRGANSWRDRIGRWIKTGLRHKQYREEHGEPAPRDLDERIATARSLEAFLRKLIGALEIIPAVGKWSHIAQSIERVARQFLLPSEKLEEALGCIRGLVALESFWDTIELDKFIELARKALSEKRISDSRFEDGGLFVGGLEGCRGVTWPCVVVAGMVEGSFPRVVREDPILLDEERKAINEMLAAAPSPFSSPPQSNTDGSNSWGRLRGDFDISRLPLKQAGHEEERLLFQLAVESARERLVLTYPRLDPFTGAERVPSIFLLHCIEALRGGTAHFASLTQDDLHRVVPLQEIGEGRITEPLLDPREYDLTTIHSSLRKGLQTLRPYLDAVSPWVARGLNCERKRWGTPLFTEFDGVFQSDEARKEIEKWCKGRVWSVTSLERFARCPFLFLLTDVLGIEEVEEPDEAETIAAKDLGNLWHDLLGNVTKALLAETLWPSQSNDRAKQLQLVEATAEKEFAEFEKQGVTVYPLLWEVHREKILADLEAWLAFETGERDYLPLHVEHRLASSTLFDISIKGRVDRIDQSVRGTRWRIFDYKTGRKSFNSESFNEGKALQIPVYMLALESSPQPPVEVSAGYYFYVTSRGALKRVGWTREALKLREPHLRDLLQRIVDSVRQGRFFLTDQIADVAGVTMPEAALAKLMEIKQADPHWQQLASLLREEEGRDD